MIIRPAIIEDIPSLVERGEMFYNEVPISQYLPYDKACIEQNAAVLIGSNDAFVYVAETPDGKIAGFISGCMMSYYWNNNDRMAHQLAFYMHPDYRGLGAFRLLTAFEEWGKSKGAKLIVSGAKKNKAYSTMNKMLTRRGYFELESVYMKGVI